MNEIKELQEEIKKLREEIALLRMSGVHHSHYHYPQPVYTPLYSPQPQLPYYVTSSSAGAC